MLSPSQEGSMMHNDRNSLRRKLQAIEQGLREVTAQLDHLTDEQVNRMGEEVDRLAFRYAKVLNLHLQDM